MTTFVDFVVASGIPRVTVVKNAKARYQDVYDPAKDFYKLLRESIVDAAEQNLNGKKTFDLVRSVLGKIKAPKLRAYEECIAGYKKWRGQKHLVWRKALGSDSPEWTQDRLVIRVNPELRVLINDNPHIIKLYFKEEKPTKQQLETMFQLLKQCHHRKRTPVTVGILDMRRGRLYSPTHAVPLVKQLLTGEAAAFQTIWDQI